jgi:TRAP transporter TAXI family solute receptor
MSKGTTIRLLVGISITLLAITIALPAYAFKWPRSIVFGTPAVGTGSHRMTSALAPILEKDTGMKVRVIPEGNEAKRYLSFSKGRITVLSASISEMELAIAGMGGFADKPRMKLRLLWHQNDTPWMFASPGNTKLKNIYDLKTTPGVKIALNNSSVGMTISVKKALLDFLQISEKDVTFVPFGSYPANVRSIGEGKADIALVSPISGVTHEIASTPIGIKWMDLPASDAEGWKRFLKSRSTSIPAEVTWGTKTSIGHYGYTSNFLYWISNDADPELVYNLTKWIHSKFDEYKTADKALTRMDMKTWRAFLDRCPAPVHESAVKYLKEIGQWTAKDDVWQAKAISQVDAFYVAFAKATAEAKKKRIRINTTNKEWTDLWAKHSKGLERLAARVD